MSKISFAKLQQKYGGIYVLTDKPDGKVVVASRNLGKAFEEAEKKTTKIPQFNLFHHMESSQTSFPASVAKKLGIDLDKCPQEAMSGYEGTTILVYHSQVKIYGGNY